VAATGSTGIKPSPAGQRIQLPPAILGILGSRSRHDIYRLRLERALTLGREAFDITSIK